MALRDVLVAFGVQVDSKDLGLLGGQVDGLIKKITGALTVGAIGGFVKSMVSAGAAIDDASNRTGVSADEFQRLAYAVTLAGGSAEGTEKALIMLQKNMKGGLGNKSAMQAFGDLADKIAAVKDPAKQTQMAMKAFGRSGAGLLPILRQGSKGVAELSQEYDDLGIALSDEFVKDAAAADDNFDRLKLQARGMGAAILKDVLPQLNIFMKWLMRLGGAFSRFVKSIGGFKTLGMAAGFLLAAKGARGLQLGLGGLGGVLKSVSSLFSVARLQSLLFYASFALIFLAVDDFIGFLQGKDSVIGRWLEKTLGIKDTDALKAQLNGIWAEIKKAFVDVKPALDSLWGSFKEFMKEDGIPKLTQMFVDLIQVIAGGATLLGAGAGALMKVSKGDTAGAMDLINQAGEGVFGKEKTLVDDKGNIRTRTIGGLFGAKEDEVRADLNSGKTNDQVGIADLSGSARRAYDARTKQMGPSEHKQTPQQYVPTPAGAQQAPAAPAQLTDQRDQRITVNVVANDAGKAGETVVKSLEDTRAKQNQNAYNAATSFKAPAGL